MKIVNDKDLTLIDPSIEELTYKAAKGAGITFIGNICGMTLQYVTSVIAARFLGADMIGTYYLGLAVVTFIAFVAQMGLDGGAMRYISLNIQNKEKVKGIIIQSLSTSFLIGLIMGVFLFISSGYIGTSIFNLESNILKVFSLAIPFLASISVILGIIRGFQNVKYSVYISNLFCPFAKFCLMYIFFWTGLNLYGLIWATVISAILGLLFALFYVKRLFPEVTSDIKSLFESKLFGYSSFLFFNGLIGFFLAWTDVLMLGYFQTTYEVGIYRVASQTALLITIILPAMNSIFIPLVAELYSKKDLEKLKELFKVISKWSFYIATPFFIIMIFLSREILNIYGAQFNDGLEIFIIFVIAYFLQVIIGETGWILAMCGRHRLLLCITTVVALLNVTLNLLLIPNFGIIGAAIATSISVIGQRLAGLILANYILGLFPLGRRHFKGLLAGLTSIVVVFLVNDMIVIQNYIFSLLFFSFLIIGIYLLMILIFRLDKEDRIILEALRKKIMISRG